MPFYPKKCSMPTTSFLRATAMVASASALAVAFALVPATVPTAPLPAARADVAGCTPIGDYPNPTNQRFGVPSGFYGTDTELGTYIAGDFEVLPGSAEAEGVIVVGGDAVFNSGDYFNLGTVGVGSQVVPAAGSDMLTTGGDVILGTTTTLDVGNNRGGNIRAGGTFTPAETDARFTYNGGAGYPNSPAPLAPFAAETAAFAALSAELAALPADGTVDLSTPGEVHLVGDGVSSRQIFTVPGTALGSLASQVAIHFDSIAPDAVVVVNVTGASASLGAWGFLIDGVLLDHTPTATHVFADWAQSITWNFTEATNVSLSLNTQLPGTVMVPTANSTLDLRTTINGRLYVNGDVSMGGGTSTGLEIHNYDQRTCSTLGAALGALQLQKILDDPYGVVDPARVYTGVWFCTLGNASAGSGTWATTAGAAPLTLATGLAPGTVCAASEDFTTLLAPPLAGFPQYVWLDPTVTPAVTIAAGATSLITVTNIVHDPIDTLPHAGAEVAGPLALAVGLLAAGLAIVLGRRVVRSRSRA